ncbi:MAG: phospholipase D-like domain-containing protein [Phormidesmis sp. CAN_BIN44]|nr:phospholipase D-like domain-containing protein [Phormidesmis sp. CAN_BIN44]
MNTEELSPNDPDFQLDELARRYNNRAGFDLVSCRDVGLPVYRITVRAITQIKKKLPPIEEFILKAIIAGLTAEAEIAAFLGLESAIARDAMVNLRMSEDIDLLAPEGLQLQEWALTQRGQRTLREAKQIVPEERPFAINFDGLLRHVKWYGRFDSRLLRPRDLRDRGFLEIPPSKSKPPELGDLKLKDVDTVVRKAESTIKQKREQERDFLALKAVDRRESFFVPAQALVYKSKSGDEVQVAFVVDGRLDADYEAAFARANSVKKLRILESLSESEPKKLAVDLLGWNYVSRVPLAALESLKQEVSSAQSTSEMAQKKLETVDADEQKEELRHQIEVAQKKIAELEQKIAEVPLDWLEVYDHRPRLDQALKDSQERLLIISPWITSASVNQDFVRQFEQLLRRNVKVYIGYGLGETKPDKKDWDLRAQKAIQDLTQKYPNFILKRLGDTHAKILISDKKFAISTSFNWLSFRGDRSRTFRDERGTIVYDTQKIDELFDSYLVRFQED